MICKLVDFLKIKLANAFASRKVRRTVKILYLCKYGLMPGVVDNFIKKYYALERDKNNIETLALGSSHGYYGFLPDGKSFNLCGTSQDLYLSYELYRRYSDLPKLKTVVLFYSVFSPGFETERSIEMDYCCYYKFFWGVPLRYHANDGFGRKMKMIDRYVANRAMEISSDYHGENEYKFFMPDTIPAQERAAAHLKHNRRQNGQTDYVRKMAKLANEKGHRLVVVVPPARSDYREHLPADQELFGELYALLDECPAVQLMSFLRDCDFEDSDFGDTDHLNRHGAEKLTGMIKDRLNKPDDTCLACAELISFPVHGDYSGSLVALEKGKDFPFEIKRVYYIWGTQKDVVRGHHAHKQLEQVVVCVSGSCDFILDNGTKRETVHLDSPTQGLYLQNNIWREFTNFSPDCVVMVLASEHYTEADYIRNYDEFLRSIGENARSSIM